MTNERIKKLSDYTSETYEDYCKCGIYEISIIGKENLFYIGQASKTTGNKNSAKGFYYRWLTHVRDLKNNRHHNKYLQNIINKYGLEKLRFKILEFLDCFSDINTINAKETAYITDYKKNSRVLNLSSYSNSFKGLTHSEESKSKMSASRIGKKQHPNTLAAIIEANTNKTVSEETRLKISNIHKGKTLSEETKNKIREANIGKIQNNSRKIIATKENEKLIFQTAVEAAKYFNISYSYTRVLCRKNHKYKEFVFSYIGKPDKTNIHSKRKVLGYINNELVYSFESVQEACTVLNISESTIRNHFKGSKLRKYPNLILTKQ